MTEADRELSVEDERRILSLLDAFEAELRRGETPEVEEYAKRIDSRLRDSLIGDLEKLLEEFETGAIAVEQPPASRVDATVGDAGMLAETAELLRVRLRAAAIIVFIAFSLFFVRSLLFFDPPMVAMRFLAMTIAAGVAWRMRPTAINTIHSCRRMEIVMLAVVGVQTTTLQLREMVVGAQQEDAVAVNSAMLFAYAVWCVISMAYGAMIPNNWRRAAPTLLVIAAIPFVTTFLAPLLEPKVQSLMRDELQFAGALLCFVASGAAIGATFTINHLRRALYRAKRFGRYRLVKRLGRGGMGEVYLAEHQLLKRPSAIKLIRPGLDSNEAAIRRFEREVQASAALAHWNTVEIFDYGRTDDGAFYYVMEYLEGLNLQQLVEQHGPLPSARVVYLLRPICAALEEAHSAGLIHRDIKPANIFAAHCGAQFDVAKLLDFGLVQESIDVGDASDSQTTSFVGTPRFMSPEQAQPDAEVEPRSDLYSLGATAYFLLTGHAPFEYGTARRCIQAHLSEQPLAPSENANVDPQLERIVLKCLEKSPAQRYDSAADLLAALDECECRADWGSVEARTWWERSQANTDTS